MPTRTNRFRKFLLSDVDKLEATTLQASATPFSFVPTQKAQYSRLTNYLDSQLTNTNTFAFVVINNVSIIIISYLVHSMLNIKS